MSLAIGSSAHNGAPVSGLLAGQCGDVRQHARVARIRSQGDQGCPTGPAAAKSKYALQRPRPSPDTSRGWGGSPVNLFKSIQRPAHPLYLTLRKPGCGESLVAMPSPRTASQLASRASANGSDVSFKCASFTSGIGGLVVPSASRAFWMQLDFGDDRPCSEAVRLDVACLVETTGLPWPNYLIQAGSAAEILWTTADHVDRDCWHEFALMLQAVVSRVLLRANPVATVQIARNFPVPKTWVFTKGRPHPVLLVGEVRAALAARDLLSCIANAHHIVFGTC